ncbi:hypothetical protein F4780DRAFT_747148 [Xylariomycetidae sp. FL0641]|nr:hypothetical protein F4780DRAFT_747148 [Xylariomycetidae sp. FL0641]
MSNTVSNTAYEPYMPSLVKALQQENRPRFELHCAVCQSMLDVSETARELTDGGCENPEALKSFYREPGPLVLEETVVLFCGHVLGFRCYVQWAAAARERGRPLRCPLCREGLSFQDCVHHQRGAKLPNLIDVVKQQKPGEELDTLGFINKWVPRTKSEGAETPSSCDFCLENWLRAPEILYGLYRCGQCDADRGKRWSKALGGFECMKWTKDLFSLPFSLEPSDHAVARELYSDVFDSWLCSLAQDIWPENFPRFVSELTDDANMAVEVDQSEKRKQMFHDFSSGGLMHFLRESVWAECKQSSEESSLNLHPDSWLKAESKEERDIFFAKVDEYLDWLQVAAASARETCTLRWGTPLRIACSSSKPKHHCFVCTKSGPETPLGLNALR